MSLTLPRFASTAERLRVERSASEVAQALRYAHARSVTENKGMLWRWNAEQRKGSLYAVTVDGTETELTDRFSASQPITAVASVEMTGPDGPIDEVHFYPDGTAEAASFTLTHGKRIYSVQVDAATSQVLYTTRSAPR